MAALPLRQRSRSPQARTEKQSFSVKSRAKPETAAENLYFGANRTAEPNLLSMSNIYFYILLALAAGAMMPTQAVTNNKMAMVVGNPIMSAFISFFVGTIALFAYLLISGVPFSNLASVKDAPLIAWVGGLLGAFFVAAAVTLVPRLGVAMTFSLIIAGQMIVTLVIDHFGLMDVPVKEVSLGRVAGIVLIAGGVVLIRKS